jgi:hypothetical protein
MEILHYSRNKFCSKFKIYLYCVLLFIYDLIYVYYLINIQNIIQHFNFFFQFGTLMVTLR